VRGDTQLTQHARERRDSDAWTHACALLIALLRTARDIRGRSEREGEFSLRRSSRAMVITAIAATTTAGLHVARISIRADFMAGRSTVEIPRNCDSARESLALTRTLCGIREREERSRESERERERGGREKRGGSKLL